MKRKFVLKRLREALAKLEAVPRESSGALSDLPMRVFPNAHFGNMGSAAGDPLPKNEKDVTDFIRRRTRLYLQSYVISAIQEAITEIDRESDSKLSREDREYYRANPER